VTSDRVYRTHVPRRDPKGRREGVTTGACAAAAAKAAARVLVRDVVLEHIDSALPNGQLRSFALERCERRGEHALCSVRKDGGDDPDCTHGAEIVCELELTDDGAIELAGGEGVAVVTRPGLGLLVGGPAINPVPRRNITEMVRQELPAWRGARVVISVPGGAELSKQTINARLGLLGGLSILGTTGIVKPYSTAAFKASVVQAIDVARRRDVATLVLTTGGKSEAYAMRLLPTLPEDAFVQVGDFIGVAIKHCARRRASRVVIVAMIGKLSKMADGRMMTHAAGSEVNLALLAELAAELGAPAELVAQVRAANTARHVLELAQRGGLEALPQLICARAAAQLQRHVTALAGLSIHVLLVDFDGQLLGRAGGPLPLLEIP
jgi:cobalt-precorrin-5B (C1)-methyltransferase